MQHQMKKMALALAGLCCGHVMAAQFSDAYFFGDSLTDNGAFANHSYNSIPALAPLQPFFTPTNNKFTSAGGKVWSEFLTTTLTGKTLQPNNPRNPANAPATGTNYAQGGAQVNTTPGVPGLPIPGLGNSPALAAMSVKQQVDAFLQQKGGVADPNAVYAVFGGANDVFYLATFLGTAKGNPGSLSTMINATTGPVKTIFQQIAAGTLSPTDGARAALTQSVADLRDQVARLQAAGAKNVIVPLLPDMGKTPAGFSNAETGSTLTSLSTSYNTLLQATLLSSGINAIPIDTISLTNDIQGNPAKYGLSNSTTTGCAGVGAATTLLCSSMVPNGDTYMYADAVHPTEAAHKIVANYVASTTDTILNTGPAIAHAMQQLPLNGGNHTVRVIDNHQRSLEGSRGQEGDFRVFADLSGNPTDFDAVGYRPAFNADTSNGNVTLGVDMLISPNSYAGFALGRNTYGGKFESGNARVDASETSLTVHGRAFVGPAYISWLVGLGQIEFDNVDTRFGSDVLATDKHGQTSGDRKMARIGAGLPLKMGALTVTPKLDVTRQNIHVSAFADNGSSFSRMTVDEQNVKSTVGTAGLEIEATLAAAGFKLRPYLEGSYRREYEDDVRTASLGVGSMLTRYRAELPTVDTSYGNVAAGVNFDLGKFTTLGINFARTLNQDNNDTRHYGMSLSSRF